MSDIGVNLIEFRQYVKAQKKKGKNWREYRIGENGIYVGFIRERTYVIFDIYTGDFVEYKNKYIDNYMHTNDQFEYKISFNGLLQHTKNMLRS